jgi:hypothetical protein
MSSTHSMCPAAPPPVPDTAVGKDEQVGGIGLAIDGHDAECGGFDHGFSIENMLIKDGRQPLMEQLTAIYWTVSPPQG